MGIDIIQLANLAKDIAKRKYELDKEYYDNFIKPTWDLFIKIHEDYKVSIKEYSKHILQDDYSIDNLLEEIRNDSIQSQDLRYELSKMVKHLPSVKFKTKQEFLSGYLESLYRYFSLREGLQVSRGRNDNKNTIEMDYDEAPWQAVTVNVMRFPLIIYLSRNRDSKDGTPNMGTRKTAVEFLDRFAIDLQKQYDNVADMYHQLKSSLLT